MICSDESKYVPQPVHIAAMANVYKAYTCIYMHIGEVYKLCVCDDKYSLFR